jgi:hypothetical protein
MKALALGVVLAATPLSCVYAQRAAEQFPSVTVDCRQLFATKADLSEGPDKGIAIDNNDLQTPLTRYRLQVVDKKILKIIKDPDRPAFRDEHGKSIWQMKRDFTDKHQIISWREDLPGGIVRVFTFDFADLVLSTMDVSPATSPAAGVELHVMKCSA